MGPGRVKYVGAPTLGSWRFLIVGSRSPVAGHRYRSTGRLGKSHRCGTYKLEGTPGWGTIVRCGRLPWPPFEVGSEIPGGKRRNRDG